MPRLTLRERVRLAAALPSGCSACRVSSDGGPRRGRPWPTAPGGL